MAGKMNTYGLSGMGANQMTLLLNKIERRLGLSVLPLPDNLKKDSWAEIIMEDTIPTFSRYFPYCITTLVNPCPNKDGWFFIDQNLPEGTVILGVKDISWESYRSDPRVEKYGIQMTSVDWLARDFCLDDAALTIAGNDLLSFFNLGIYIEFEYPNKIKLVSVNGFPVSQYRPFPLKVFIQHPGLWTISPTMMEQFEKLAMCDVAISIYQVLKYYDNMDTQYATLSLQLDTIQEWANKREDIVRELDEAHTTTANEFGSLIMTV